MSFMDTKLWKSSLEPQLGDQQGGARERLRSEFLKFRERAATLTGEIKRDMPDFTVHDISHLARIIQRRLADVAQAADLA